MPERAHVPLRCTCTIAVRRGGVVRPVRQRRWSCPSCARDKRERLAVMAMVARPVRMVTLTVRDDIVPDGSWSLDGAGRPVTHWLPYWHDGGDPWGHCYTHPDGTARFAPQTWCAPCLRHLGGLWKCWVKRARKVLPGLEYQWVTEQTKGQSASGSVPRFHRHVLLAGIPRWLTPDVRDKLTQDWSELAGNLDLGRPPKGGVDAGTWRRFAYYLSKYLTKAQTPMAFGYRRWGRSRGYAAEIPMLDPREVAPWGDAETEAVCLGPYTEWAARHAMPVPASLAPAGPDPP